MTWARWRPEIAKACDGSHHTIENIEREIAEGRAHFLGTADCCFVAEIVGYPTETACQVLWTAGDLEAVKAALPKLEAWARENGCTEMLIEGRPGWARALRDQDYGVWSVTTRKALT